VNNPDPVPTGPGMGGPPPRPLTCDSQECQSALVAVATDRNRVLSKCAQLEATKGRRDTLAAIVAGLLILAGALLIGAGAATATVFGVPLAVVLVIAAIAVFVVVHFDLLGRSNFACVPGLIKAAAH